MHGFSIFTPTCDIFYFLRLRPFRYISHRQFSYKSHVVALFSVHNSCFMPIFINMLFIVKQIPSIGLSVYWRKRGIFWVESGIILHSTGYKDEAKWLLKKSLWLSRKLYHLVLGIYGLKKWLAFYWVIDYSSYMYFIFRLNHGKHPSIRWPWK